MPKSTFRTIVRTACALALIGVYPAYAVDYIREYVPDAKPVGQGRLSYMFWDIYDATLFAPNGEFSSSQPLAIQISYLRTIEGKKIADRSAEEMRLQGFSDEVRLADWHAQMRAIFPDVSEGVTLTGVLTQSGETIFYSNDVQIGSIADKEFGRRFFNIWLSEATSAPDLRKKLLGSL